MSPLWHGSPMGVFFHHMVFTYFRAGWHHFQQTAGHGLTPGRSPLQTNATYSLQHLPIAAGTVTGMDYARSCRTAGWLATENLYDRCSGDSCWHGTASNHSERFDPPCESYLMIRLKKDSFYFNVFQFLVIQKGKFPYFLLSI